MNSKIMPCSLCICFLFELHSELNSDFTRQRILRIVGVGVGVGVCAIRKLQVWLHVSFELDQLEWELGKQFSHIQNDVKHVKTKYPTTMLSNQSLSFANSINDVR